MHVTYASEAAAAHKQTARYFARRDAVADMMAELRRGVPRACLGPE